MRLGGLAANLLRIRSYADRPDHKEVVSRLVRESALFIEWTAADVDPTNSGDLAELQRRLSLWYRNWELVWADEGTRTDMAREAGDWSQHSPRQSGARG